jgi:hypothetical protein
MDTRPALRTTRTAVTASSAEVVHLPGGRAAITGTIGEVGQALAHLQNTGRLVSSTAPAPTGVRGQVLVNVRLVPRPQAHAVHPAPVRRQLSTRAVAAVAGGAVVLLAGCGWMLYAAVTALVDNAAVIVGALALVGGALVVLGKVGGRTFSGTFQGRMD